MSEELSGRILVGVSGGIAAYKAVQVVRDFVRAGFEVRVIPTKNALRMVGAATWEAVSGHPIYTDPFAAASGVGHIEIAREAKALVVVPATANTIAKFAAGLADDMLSTTALSVACPIFMAPAMHTQMWQAPAVVDNVRLLKQRGVNFIGPTSGQLTSGDTGLGRMVEAEEIVHTVLNSLQRGGRCEEPGQRADLARKVNAPGLFSGIRVVVSAGGTHERLDPVRFLGNRSTGRQGIEIAKAAQEQGADVTLVQANIETALLEELAGVEVVRVESALQMQSELERLWDQTDVLVMAAAVADYRPAQIAAHKLKKTDGSNEARIELIENPDILRGLGSRPRAGKTLVGFAAETAPATQALEFAAEKAQRKNTDLLVLNRISDLAGFGDVVNNVIFISRDGQALERFSGSKPEIAQRLLRRIALLRGIVKDEQLDS